MASVFLVQDPNDPKLKTFYFDDKLPPLPLATLDECIEKYLDSCKAILTDEEYKTTNTICQAFVNGEGKMLHEMLQHRANEKKNWLEEWWQNKVYLEGRWPLPLGNFSGPGTYVEHYWPLVEGTLLERTALGMHFFMQFWNLVRKQMISAHKTSKGKPLTMHQFRYLFNTCRIPQKGKDTIHHGFKTEVEGTSPSHIIVLCKGHVYKMHGTNPNTGEIYGPAEFLAMYRHICNECESIPEGPGVAALTCLERDKWAEVRERLIEIDPVNKAILEEIETSLLVSSVDYSSPQDYSDLSYLAMFADDPATRWYDKSYTCSTSSNGGYLCNCDHTPYDAMVMVALVEFMTFSVKDCKGQFNAETVPQGHVLPTKLEFKLEKDVVEHINEAKLFHKSLKDNLELLQLIFDKFGKAALKNYKLHPDFMVQVCLQLAYMEVHGKPGPTYETAMTRRFYHGRTETCRTCTPEVVAFCNAMRKNPEPQSKEYKSLHNLLMIACDKFVHLMNDCMENKGCDRCLLGMLFTSSENGHEIPEIFTDPAFSKSGGNGNFVLSTSCVGYLHAQGGVPPMVENGYGFFYRINNNKIAYSISAFNSCKETSARKMADYFEYSLASVMQILINAESYAKM